uniref:BZIP domain-containing protein n=1 Tax=Panagrellus redivivus TaxID=6233 RepID=A0A7E4UX54_PANRE
MEGSNPNAAWYQACDNAVYYPDDAYYYSSQPYYDNSMQQWSNHNVEPVMGVPIMRQHELQYPQIATTMSATNIRRSSMSNDYLDHQNAYSQQFSYQFPSWSPPASNLSNSSTVLSQYSTSPPESQSLPYCYDSSPNMPQWNHQPIQPTIPVALPELQYPQAPIPTSSFNPQPFTNYPDHQNTYPSQLQNNPPPSQSPPASYSSSSCSSRSSTSPSRCNSQELHRRPCGRPRVFSSEERHRRKLESANRSRRKKNDNLKMLEKSVETKQNALKRMSTMHANLLDLENVLLSLA